jgi:hypothetical protein
MDAESLETDTVGRLRNPTNTCSTTGFFLKHSRREVCRRLCYYLISFASCFLAILAALIANTVIDQAPLLFLKMAEIAEGEVDMVLTPSSEGVGASEYVRFINSTRVDLLMRRSSAPLAPRLSFTDTKLYAREDGNSSVDIIFLGLDSAREKELKIGTRYDSPKLAEGACAIPTRVAGYLGLHTGDEAAIDLGIGPYLEMLHQLYIHDATDLQNNSVDTVHDLDCPYKPFVAPAGVMIKCRVVSTFETLGGKMGAGKDDNYMWMELEHILKHVSKEAKDLDPGFREYIARFNPYGAVSTLLWNHPQRQEVYSNTDFEDVQASLAKFSSEILDVLGFYPVRCMMPIMDSLLPLSMGSIFLKIILNLVVVLLAAVSCFLIYSLLMITVETRTFEMGIFRMLGISKSGLSLLVVVQALLFVVPAFVVALVMTFPLLVVLSGLFDKALGFAFAPSDIAPKPDQVSRHRSLENRRSPHHHRGRGKYHRLGIPWVWPYNHRLRPQHLLLFAAVLAIDEFAADAVDNVEHTVGDHCGTGANSAKYPTRARASAGLHNPGV